MTQKIQIALACVAAFAGLQFIKPHIEMKSGAGGRNLFEDIAVDSQVRGILKRSCGDCHSDQVRLPWYAQIAPASWIIVRHVNRGRTKLNFSDWPSNATDEKQDIADSIDKKDMPMSSYLWIHRNARLSEADRKTIDAWADGR